MIPPKKKAQPNIKMTVPKKTLSMLISDLPPLTRYIVDIGIITRPRNIRKKLIPIILISNQKITIIEFIKCHCGR